MHTGWDLGIGDSTAIWMAQGAGRELRLIDYYEGSGVGLDHYVLRDKPYVYGEHMLPHDVQAELGTGKSRLEMLASLGLGAHPRAATSARGRHPGGAQPAAARWIDAEKCASGLEALALPPRIRRRAAALRAQAVHDWTSHAADALRYLAMTLDGRAAQSRFHRRIEYSRQGIA